MAEASSPSEPADRSAPPFERLLEHAAWLRALARHLVDDAAAAEDLVQETWLAAVRRPPIATQPLQPWLAGVARKLAAFTRRGEERRRRRESEQPPPGIAPSTDELVARAELQRRLVERVLALREPSRSTVLRCYFEGLAPSEAAREIGVPAATVRTRLKRALDELREQFDAEQRNDGVDWRGAFAMFSATSGAGGGTAVVVAKVAAGFVMAAVGIVAWKYLDDRPRDVAPPARVATATDEPRRRAEMESAEAPVPARVPESLAPAIPTNDAKPATTPDPRPAKEITDPDMVIRGQLLLPDGSGARSCRVDFRVPSTPTKTSDMQGVFFSKNGEFLFTSRNVSASADQRILFVAHARVDGHSFSRVFELPLVSQDNVEIRLVDAPMLRVHVVDEQRAPVETFRCVVPDSFAWTSSEDQSDAVFTRRMTNPETLQREGGQIESHPGGRCEVVLPLDRYVVVIDAPGFERGIAGPFRVEPPLDPVSRDVELVLRRTSAIAGRVVAGGRPVEGALVALHALPPNNRHFVLDDRVLDVDPWNGERVTTDANGKFALPRIAAPEGARLYVLADGFARSESAIDADRLDRSSDLVVELRAGGTLIGSLTGLEGMIRAGRTDRITKFVVVMERRDLWPVAARVDAQGRFRIEHLAPGGWRVSLPRNGENFEGADFGKSGSGGLKDGAVPPPDWNVEIRDGGETSVSFDAFTGPPAH